MKIKTILVVLASSLFLTAQAAVDAGKKAQISNGQVTGQAAGQVSAKVSDQDKTDAASATTLNAVQTQMNSDIQLEGRVLQQLRSSIKNFDPNKYMILSRNGEVTLQGNVKTQAEAELMEKEAIKVSGVTRVNNNLAVIVTN